MVSDPLDVVEITGDSDGGARTASPETNAAPRVIAFYLPQFHPIPENDQWWGKGFTEWTNVAAAKPLFRGHRQPQIPADLGFYDLRVPEARAAQAALAASFGVGGFCYWHYWFNGRTILDRPLTEVLRSGEPDFPFCLGWANQTWTGVWHGAPDKVLIEQTYPGALDDEAHFASLLPAFRDRRYIQVNGRPLFYVFRPEELPEPGRWVERWRRMAEREGLPGLYLVAEVSDLLGRGPRHRDYQKDGFDAGAYIRLPAEVNAKSVFLMRLRRKLRGGPEVYPYAGTLPEHPASLDETLHPCIYPNWDNTPRSGRLGLVLRDSTPAKFRAHARSGIERALLHQGDEQLLFVKSWNEWAEGNYLEPDRVNGTGYLEVLCAELDRVLTPKST